MTNHNYGLNVFEAAQQWQPSFTMVLDRIEGTWVVTGWPTGDAEVSLRLRISFSPDEEMVAFQFEVGSNWGTGFVNVGEAKASCLCGCAFADAVGLFAQAGVPEIWREDFREMLRRWAAVTVILEPMDEYVPGLVATRPGAIGAFSRSESSEKGRPS
jgi:hypothetical protein